MSSLAREMSFCLVLEQISKKGGDIDLYFVVKNHDNLFEKKIKFLSRVKRELGEQKIDIVFNIDSSRLIEKEAIKWGIKL